MLFTFLSFTFLNAQTSFSCKYRQYCDWDENSKEFENCRGYDESSLFVFNQTETMFTHTTESIKSTYYVNTKKHDQESGTWSYQVTSDVGNQYLYVIDPKNNQIRALYVTNGQAKLIVFTIKAIF